MEQAMDQALALQGGEKAVTAPVPRWPMAGEADEQALAKSLSSLPRRNGPCCESVARAFADFCQVPYVLPVANGTVSLELILRALEIGYGDEVILPPYTFIATASSILFTQATPVFADIDPDTYNLSPEAARAAITPKTKAIIAVAVGGRPMDLMALEALSEETGIPLIVDAAQAVGAMYDHRSIAAFGIAASFSCQNTKNWTGGEGGFITTASPAFYEKLQSLLSQIDYGMHEAQAALLESQLRKLPGEIAKRSQNADYLRRLLSPCPMVKLLSEDPRITVNAYHLFILKLDEAFLNRYALTREEVLAALQAEGVPISAGYLPLYSFGSLTSPRIAAITGGPLRIHPCPAAEKAGCVEGAWMVQETLLGDEILMEQIASAFHKVAAYYIRGGENDA